MSRLMIRRKPERIAPDYVQHYSAFPILKDEKGNLRAGGWYDLADIREGRLAIPELSPAEVAYVRAWAAFTSHDVEEIAA